MSYNCNKKVLRVINKEGTSDDMIVVFNDDDFLRLIEERLGTDVRNYAEELIDKDNC